MQSKTLNSEEIQEGNNQVPTTGKNCKWFSKAMFLQTLNTYAPIPIAYGLLIFLAIPMDIFMWDPIDPEIQMEIYVTLAEYADYGVRVGLASAFLLGILSAMMVFRYVCENRSTNMVHALPIRREALYITQYLAGLTFVILPNLINLGLTLLACTMQGVSMPEPFLHLVGVHCGLYFFFYSFAVLCAMFTGSVGTVALFYLALNFIVAFVTLLVQPLLEIYYLGYAGSTFDYPFVQVLTPIYALAFAGRINYDYDMSAHQLALGDTNLELSVLHTYLPEYFSFWMEEPQAFLAYLAVAVLFFVVGLFVYKGRHLEMAGEAVSVRETRPLFRLVWGIIGGVSMGIVSVFFVIEDTSDAGVKEMLAISSFIWSFVFCFVAEMILQKSFRVLSAWKKTLVPAGVMVVGFSILLFDLTGFEDYIPERAEVDNLVIQGLVTYPYDTFSFIGDLPKEDGISQENYTMATDLHRTMIAEAREYLEAGSSTTQGRGAASYLNYTLNDGYVIQRAYIFEYELEDLQNPDSFASQYMTFINDRTRLEEEMQLERIGEGVMETSLLKVYDQEEDVLKEGVINALNTDLTSKDVQEIQQYLVTAVIKDFEEGNLGKKYISYEDEEYIQDGLYGGIKFIWRTNSGNITGNRESLSNTTPTEEQEGGTDRGETTELNTTRESVLKYTTIMLNQDCVHTLKVIEDYALWGEHGTFLTNLEMLDLAMGWFHSPSVVDQKKINLPFDHDATDIDFYDPMSFVTVLQ